jgi:hypothetical protein
MRPGIDKNEVLGMLTDMVYSLEEAETILHHSLAGMRAEICRSQSEKIENLGIVLDGLEANASNTYNSHSLIQEARNLKLELGF